MQNCIQHFYSLRDNAPLIIEFLSAITYKYSGDNMDENKNLIMHRSFAQMINKRFAYLLISIRNYDLVYEFAKTLKDRSMLLNLKLHASISGWTNLAKKIQKKINKLLAEEIGIQRNDPHFKFYKNIKNLAAETDISIVDMSIQKMMEFQNITHSDIEKTTQTLFGNSS